MEGRGAALQKGREEHSSLLKVVLLLTFLCLHFLPAPQWDSRAKVLKCSIFFGKGTERTALVLDLLCEVETRASETHAHTRKTVGKMG